MLRLVTIVLFVFTLVSILVFVLKMIEVDSEHNVDSISLTCGAVQLSH